MLMCPSVSIQPWTSLTDRGFYIENFNIWWLLFPALDSPKHNNSRTDGIFTVFDV
jgi:hypothetical protein